MIRKTIPYILILVSITLAGFVIPTSAGAVECVAVAPDKSPSNTPEGCTHTVSVTISPAVVKPGNPATIAIVVNPDPDRVNTTIYLGDNDSSIKNALTKSNLICTDARNTSSGGPQCLIAFVPTTEMVGTVNIKYSTTVRKTVDFKSVTEPTVNGTLSVQVDANASPSTTKATAAGGSTTRDPAASASEDFDCDLLSGSGVTGCVAAIIYNVIFVPMAAFTRLTAMILDFFVYYSTNSSSYTGPFVEEGWGAVRDVANIFFIIALLYIAIKTVLSLEGSNSKKLIANIVIVALIINFSLFTTRVVIDASNIIAKIFYNNISSSTDAKAEKNPDGSFKTSVSGQAGEKSISVGLVKKFNPTDIVTTYDSNRGQFIFITLLSIALMAFMSYIFLSVAVLFVGRVVSLWMSMIFAPLAFISYTVPFDIPGFGHKKWWDDLLKNAFLAPLFIFFLYIIILFGDFFTLITYGNEGADFTQKAMKTIIPFAIVFILLQKAKKLAVEYSGEMGKAVMTGAKMVGGLALGATAGVAGMAGRNLIGRQFANLAESNKFRDWATNSKIGRFTSNRVTGLAQRSFDIRGVKVAGKDLGGVTGMKLGDTQKGGFIKAREEQVKKTEEFVKKQLDVSDAGKAELTRGDMDIARATQLRDQMRDGGMNAVDQQTYYNQMIGGGITPDDLSKVSRYINASRRDVYADRLEKRTLPSIFGTLQGPAQKRRASLRIAANKIRESADTAQKKANLATLAAGVVAAGVASPPTPAGGTGGTGTGTTGGGTTGGGGTHP